MTLTKPTLLIDPEQCQRNITAMTQKARQHGLIFRPHFKTHQSRKIGQWFRDRGIDKITVSSVDMARYFSQDGWQDITIAFPLNINEIPQIDQLAATINLHLTLLNEESVEALHRSLHHPVEIFIKIDTGSKRTGLPHQNVRDILHLKEKIEQTPQLHFKGLLAHPGHTYQANSREEILAIHRQTRDRMVALRDKIRKNNEPILLSVGDTPSNTLADEFEGIDEIRPGNFVFYDLQQYKLQVCSLSDIAVAVACPVVAKHEDQGRIVVFGGAVHLSKDTFMDGRPVYGYGVIMNENGWIIPEQKVIVSKVSQEHGILNVSPYMMKRVSIGDFLGILPAHSCLTANLMGSYWDHHQNRYDHMRG